MNKGGISKAVIIISLSILVLIVAGIIAAIFYNSLKTTSEESEKNATKISINPSGVFINNQAKTLTLSVKRETGQGNLIGLKFIVTDKTGNVAEDRYNITLKESEEKNFSILIPNLNLNNLSYVEVIPIIKTDRGEEELGDSADKYEFSSDKSETVDKKSVSAGSSGGGGGGGGSGGSSGGGGTAPAPAAGDTTPPAVSSVSALNSTNILVVFNEQLNKASTENKTNYEIEKASNSSISLQVFSSTLQNDGKTVSLTTSSHIYIPNETLDNYVLILNRNVSNTNIKDLAGNLLPATIKSYRYAPTLPCDLTSASWNTTSVVNNTQVKLNVQGTNCNGESFNYLIESYNGGNIINSFTSNSLNPTWNAVYIRPPFGGNAQYIFIVSVVSNPNEIIESRDYPNGILEVIEPVSVFCGDGSCNDDETCSTCWNDCGICLSGYLGISIATLKENYTVGEHVKLTDPPEKIKHSIESRSGDYLENINSIRSLENLEFEGYIIEFKNPPVAKERLKLKEYKASKNEEKEKLVYYKEELKKEHNSAIEDIESRLLAGPQFSPMQEGGFISKIISKLKYLFYLNKIKILQSPPEKIEIKSEFYNSFNGIAVSDISVEEVELIKNSPYVKSVRPNMKVQLNLVNSVPLIQEGILAGQLDEDGNDCTTTGKQCLTGEGVSIAIIDTGIDYTHKDFGSCNGINSSEVWSTIPAGTIVNVSYETDHPYNNSGEYSFNVTHPDFSNMALHFSNFSTERTWDLVGITNESGYFISLYHGSPGNFWTKEITGNLTIVEFFPESYTIVGENNDKYGFKIDMITNKTSQKVDIGECSKIVGGYDFVEDGYTFFNESDTDPKDRHGHGTHVAGIISGDGTLKGAAPNSQLYIYKALNEDGSGLLSWIISSIDASLDPNQDGNLSDHVDIISMSLGVDCGGIYDSFCGPDDALSTAVNNAVNEGVVVVVAAGNSGPYENTITSPGTAEKAITVGASDFNDGIADFSSRGPVYYNGQGKKPDIVAPGDYICSSHAKIYDWFDGGLFGDAPLYCFDEEHVLHSGTSMSAPHISGAAALLKQKNPNLTPDEIKTLLMDSAANIRADQYSQGAGRVNIKEALILSQKPQSKIANIHTNNITGNLTIKIQRFNATSWINHSIVYQNSNEIIPAGSLIKLDMLFNQQNVTINGQGLYKVYVIFEFGLEKIETEWEFNIS
ncbi:MAG: S8 family serine peptidase [Nanoarchaeota archaeon]